MKKKLLTVACPICGNKNKIAPDFTSKVEMVCPYNHLFDATRESLHSLSELCKDQFPCDHCPFLSECGFLRYDLLKGKVPAPSYWDDDCIDLISELLEKID